MLERLLLLLVLAILGTVAVVGARAWTARRTRRLYGTPLLGALGQQPDGRRTLVTFSTPSCAACHTAQAPAVRTVEDLLGAGELRVVKVDAASQPETARAFGVLTVPSTVVLDADGKVAAVNHGFAPSQRLVQQLQNA
jgi:thioredoxin-like negative regulator of GroEL